MAAKDKIIFALDVADNTSAQEWIKTLSGQVGWIKVGLELFCATGPALVKDITSQDIRCFLDLKFHDIPNTAAGAVRSATALGAEMMTIHISGGRAMMKAAVQAATEEAERLGVRRPNLIGVSVLTSLDENDMRDLNISKAPSEQAAHLAALAAECGLDGMVCSPADLELVRKNVPSDFTIITPGIRPAWSAKGDQARIATPASAIAAGSSMMVIGRPISQADDPVDAVARIIKEIEEA